MIKTGLLLSTALPGSLVAGAALADDGAQTATAKPIVLAQASGDHVAQRRHPGWAPAALPRSRTPRPTAPPPR